MSFIIVRYFAVLYKMSFFLCLLSLLGILLCCIRCLFSMSFIIVRYFAVLYKMPFFYVFY